MTPLNETDHFDCHSCDNYGVIEIFHRSTDALIGHRDCPDCTNRKPLILHKSSRREVYIPALILESDAPPF